MRTMLILIFLCSLAQFAESAGIIEGCGTSFKCFAPSMCTDSAITSVTASAVVEVKQEATESNCPAIIKFHQYNDFWAYISIVSFIAGDTPVVYSQYEDFGGDLKTTEFKCENLDKLRFSYNGVVKNTEDIATGPIECTFEMKLDASEKIFKKITLVDDIRMTIKNEQTVATLGVQSMLINVGTIKFCDPSEFYFVSVQEEHKVYDKVQYKFGECYCPDKDLFKIEYRKENSKPEDYDDVLQSIECVGSKFQINGKRYMSADWLYIRCVADAEYYCDYDAKNKGQLDPNDEKGLVLERPVKNPKKKGSLKCPAGYPHLYIDNLPPLTNPTIECLNYGGKQFWTVTANKAILTANGPQVYCSKKLDCSINNRISAKSIKNGYLALQNSSLTPKCYDDGILTVDGKQITNVACDYSTGEFKYNENIIVTPDTTFICTYKPKPNAKENKKNEERMQHGLTIVIGTCVGGFFLGIIIVVAVIKINSAMTRRRINRETDEHYVNFLMNEKEKDAFHKKNKTKPANKNQPVHWTNFLMHSQYFNEVDILAKAKPSHVDPPKEKSYTARKNEGKTVTKLKKYGRSYSPILDNMVTKYDKDVDAGKILYDSNMKDKMEKLRIEKAKAASKPPSK